MRTDRGLLLGRHHRSSEIGVPQRQETGVPIGENSRDHQQCPFQFGPRTGIDWGFLSPAKLSLSLSLYGAGLQRAFMHMTSSTRGESAMSEVQSSDMDI